MAAGKPPPFNVKNSWYKFGRYQGIEIFYRRKYSDRGSKASMVQEYGVKGKVFLSLKEAHNYIATKGYENR
jgi:hypothetical protein